MKRAMATRPDPLPDIGPVRFRDHEIILRAPEFGDFALWRELRLRDRTHIEPFWISDPRSWEDRHRKNRWIRECLDTRACAKRRSAMGYAIEVDGRFGGQIAASDIDLEHRSAELGTWLAAELAGQGIATVAIAMFVKHLMTELGIDRIVAPVHVDNEAARRGLRRGGFRCEATSVESFHAGGRRGDHELWVITREMLVLDGLVEGFIESFAGGESRGVWTGMSEADGPGSRINGLEVAVERLGRPVRTARRRLLHMWSRPQPAGLGVDDDSPVQLRPVSRSGTTLDFTVEGAGRTVARCGYQATDWVRSTAELWVDDLDPTDPRLAEAAIGMLIEHAFEVAHMHRVSLTVLRDSPDVAPGGVSDTAERVGMRREGTLRDCADARGRWGDHDLWGLTRTQTRPPLSSSRSHLR